MRSAADPIPAWALRPASRPDAGGGHVARCAALGSALASHGPVVAIIEKGGESWIERFNDAGISIICEGDLGNRMFAGAVLDDYDLRPQDVALWRRRAAGPIVQIEDSGTPLPGIDLAVNATPGLAGQSLGEMPALLGSSFAMLAAPYTGRPRPPIKARVDRVAVGIGWTDAHGVTERVLAALSRVMPSAARVDVMLGSRSPNVARVAAMMNARPAWRLHCDVTQPWLLLDGADMAVSGAGQSLLERLALGIPTLAVAVTNNQKPALSGVVASGAALGLGGLEQLSEDGIASSFHALAGDVKRRWDMSTAAQRLVDGQGAVRVARHLVELSKSFAARRRA